MNQTSVLDSDEKAIFSSYPHGSRHVAQAGLLSLVRVRVRVNPLQQYHQEGRIQSVEHLIDESGTDRKSVV